MTVKQRLGVLTGAVAIGMAASSALAHDPVTGKFLPLWDKAQANGNSKSVTIDYLDAFYPPLQ